MGYNQWWKLANSVCVWSKWCTSTPNGVIEGVRYRLRLYVWLIDLECDPIMLWLGPTLSLSERLILESFCTLEGLLKPLDSLRFVTGWLFTLKSVSHTISQPSRVVLWRRILEWLVEVVPGSYPKLCYKDVEFGQLLLSPLIYALKMLIKKRFYVKKDSKPHREVICLYFHLSHVYRQPNIFPSTKKVLQLYI